MGTWGTGNFESDAALDFFFEVQEELLAKVRPVINARRIVDVNDLDAVVVPCVEILALLGEHVNLINLPREELQGWREKSLAAFDEQIDEYEPAEGYKEARRRVMEQTFDRLAKVLPSE